MVATLAGVPFCLGAGALMQYISFDYVCWVVVAWGMVKLVTAEVASEEKSEDRNSKFAKRNSEGGGRLAVRAAHGKKPGVRGQESAEKEERFLASRTPLGMTGLRGGERRGGAFGEETGSGPPQKAVPTKAWWVVVGAGIGFGMLAKYTMGLLVAGVVVGVLATPLRRHLRNPWLWAGVVLSVAIFLPNFLWEWRHGFVSADFLWFLHERDVREGVTDGFLLGQLEVTMLAAPLAAAGLWFYFAGARHKEKEKTNAGTQRAQRFAEEDPLADSAMYGVLGWMYVVPLVLLVVLRGRDYYLAPAYPMLYAAGAVWAERKWAVGSGEWRETTKKRSNEVRKGSNDENGKRIENGQDAEVAILRPHTTRPQDDNAFLGRWVRRVVWVALMVDVMVAGAVALPIAPVNSRWWKVTAKIDPVFPEEIGGEEFTQSVAEVWGGLPEA